MRSICTGGWNGAPRHEPVILHEGPLAPISHGLCAVCEARLMADLHPRSEYRRTRRAIVGTLCAAGVTALLIGYGLVLLALGFRR